VDSNFAKLMANFPRAGKWSGSASGSNGGRRWRHSMGWKRSRATVWQAITTHRKNNGKRQVTLIQAEHLVALATLLGKPVVRPEWVRRNILVSGINLYALRDRCFRIGDTVLEGTGTCDPCSRMEEALGREVTTPCGVTAASLRASPMAE